MPRAAVLPRGRTSPCRRRSAHRHQSLAYAPAGLRRLCRDRAAGRHRHAAGAAGPRAAGLRQAHHRHRLRRLAGRHARLRHAHPAVASRFGAVPAIIGAVLAGALLTVAYTVTSGPVAWAALSFLHGIVGGVPWVVSEIWMNVVAEEKHRGRVMGLYAAMVALGMALGPVVLQVVGVYGPWPFMTAAGLSLLVAVPLLPYWHTAPRILVYANERLRGRRRGGAARAVHRLRLRPRRAGRFQLPAGLCRRRRRVGGDRHALAVGLRNGQRRAAMADRLAGRSPAYRQDRAGRLHLGQHFAGRRIAAGALPAALYDVRRVNAGGPASPLRSIRSGWRCSASASAAATWRAPIPPSA